MRRTNEPRTWDGISAVCRSLELERRYPSIWYDGDNGRYEPDFERRVAPLWDAGPKCPSTGVAQYEDHMRDMARDLVLDMRAAGYPVEYGWYFGEDGGQNMLEVYMIEGAALRRRSWARCGGSSSSGPGTTPRSATKWPMIGS
jgi:hypothetical protein